MIKISAFIFCLLPAIGLISCSDENKSEYGEIEIEFDNVVGDDDLALNTSSEVYTNSAGESYKVTTLRYYISNIVLKKNDGSSFSDTVSPDGSKGFYLIDESDNGSQHIHLENVPVGDYSEISFTIGVDATTLNQSSQTGPLNPADGMFWNWNSGYIFVMIEGISTNSSDPSKEILYHVGGYKTDTSDPSLANNLKSKTLSLGTEPALVRGDMTPEIHMIVDVDKFFASPHQIRFSENPVQDVPAENAKIADNYVNTFIVDHIHN
ncbi:MAG TPA: MbnP family protein [Cyclobacteriaceae bacterium]|nr:MbnP family protein [Cyclobacteriaceae bacterium]